jgi:hypothetical protein
MYILGKNAQGNLVRNSRIRRDGSGAIGSIDRRDGTRTTRSHIERVRKQGRWLWQIGHKRLGSVESTPLSLVFKRAFHPNNS